jgi:hypothetical protein
MSEMLIPMYVVGGTGVDDRIILKCILMKGDGEDGLG